MRVNLEWLRDWVELDDDAESIAADLTTAGLEVDSVEAVGEPMPDVVVAAVLRVDRHPNADRLSVCVVDDGIAEHQVVCGARNVAAGCKAPLARVGARLPGGQVIAAAELRGVRSNGMLCSAKELGLVDDVDGLLLLDADAPVGEPIADYLRLVDTVFEINVTPNRGDCFSVVGIARELAARRVKPLAKPRPTAAHISDGQRWHIELAAGGGCPRFAARVVTDIDKHAQTPLWMRERLRRAGLRPIQPIVDVTNYVMLELGQPLHAYDLTKLEGPLVARWATPGEPLTLLDGRKLELADDVLVIADSRSAVGLAGVMGGQRSAVGPTTEAVVLESAWFAPSAIAGRARRFGLHTDASLRFERGVDPAGQERAIERATELLLSIAGGVAAPLNVVERTSDVPRRTPVVLRRQRLDALLGVAVAPADVAQLLSRLEMRVEPVPEGWQVSPPPFRFDIAIEEDLVEEVGRMIGYDRIPATPGIAAERLGFATESTVAPDRLADCLVDRGYSEAVTYSFVAPELDRAVSPGAEPVTLTNPIANDMAVMRQSLWPGLIGAARLNLSHQRQRLKLFELGPVFMPGEQGAGQKTVLAGIAVGSRHPEHWDGGGAELDLFDVKGDVEALLRLAGRYDECRFEPAVHAALSPGRTARIMLAGDEIGWLGVLHPDLQPERKREAIVFALDTDAAFKAMLPKYREYSRFPYIRRDLAIVVDEHVSSSTLTSVARNAAGTLLQHVNVFDVYRGKGVDSRRKSVALGLILQDVSRTLTDEDADKAMRSVMLELERELGATIRT